MRSLTIFVLVLACSTLSHSLLFQVIQPRKQEDHGQHAPVPNPIFEGFFRWEAQKLWPEKSFSYDRSILDQLDGDMERKLFRMDESTTESPSIPEHRLLLG